MSRFVRNIILGCCYLFSLYALPLFAQLSPGDLHKNHSQLEGLDNCTKCHEVRKRVSAKRCLDCHKLLAERIQNGKGLHSSPDYRQCENCHVEHQGRDFELVYWKGGQEQFDHQKTGYPLEGKHKNLQCRKCHTARNIVHLDLIRAAGKDPERTFLGLGTKCADCHADEHRGQFSKTSCESCHSQNHWKPAEKFDHNRARFPLTGKHKKVQCEKCHSKISDHQKQTVQPYYFKFRPLPHQKCVNCHKDPHQNKFGENCLKCHSTSGWKQVKSGGFNHDLTAFPLRGRHKNVECSLCHKNGINQPLQYAHCADCHPNEHVGQFASGRNPLICEDCHTVEGFLPSLYKIAEHQKTAFPLTGAHLAIPCIACHTRQPGVTGRLTPVFKFKDKTCANCHKSPHEETLLNLTYLSGCESCHLTNSWQEVQFEHNRTRFPLRWQHQKLLCAKCHQKSAGRLVKFSGLNSRCESCHKDPHAAQFASKDQSTDCSRCHVEKDWLAEKFDHNRDAAFQTTGAHAQVPCASCHPTIQINGKPVTKFKGVPKTCAECHASSPKKGG